VQPTREDGWDRDAIVPWILGLSGFRVTTMDEGESRRLVIRIERCGVRRYACSGCGRRTACAASSRDRTWDDLPRGAHHVTLVYRQRRVTCRHCGIRTERVEFADPKARVTVGNCPPRSVRTRLDAFNRCTQIGEDQKRNARRFDSSDGRLSKIIPAVTYSPTQLARAVPSAVEGLTSVFGMGTGVTPLL
jgi:zinc-finger of transposase IS204/IS1001/IS1096/IS1165